MLLSSGSRGLVVAGGAPLDTEAVELETGVGAEAGVERLLVHVLALVLALLRIRSGLVARTHRPRGCKWLAREVIELLQRELWFPVSRQSSSNKPYSNEKGSLLKPAKKRKPNCLASWSREPTSGHGRRDMAESLVGEVSGTQAGSRGISPSWGQNTT
jgi:hypothetical protein